MASRGGILKILDAYVAVNGDTSGLDSAVDQSVAKAVAAGGKIESALSPRKVLGALGAAAGLVFATMLNGSNELDAAMRQLQADTGMTDAQAKAAEHSLAGMAKTNLQSFGEIGAVMAVVHNELGLVGAAADAVTERFLRYATATGQGAAPAASDFAQILKAFNVDASQTPAIMDKLIASHQVYGTVVTEDQAALAAMAPALGAMNMGIDDGIALLNLFKDAGISAAKAPMALNLAVKQLKPGQDLNDLIAQISSIEDPTLRAQKATAIFGKSGTGWGKTFKDNTVILSDFNTTTEENAGATTKAADAIESGFGNKFKLIMNNAKATLAEFGTGFGDIIGIAQLFGPGLTRAIAMGFGGLAGLLSTKIIPAILATGPGAAIAGSTVGKLAGAAMGAAVPIALAAGLGLAVALAFKAIVLDPGTQQQLRDIGVASAKLITTGTVAELEQAKAAMATGIKSLSDQPFGGFLNADAISGLQTQLDAFTAELERRAAGIPAAVADGVASGTPEVALVIADLLKTITGTGMGAVNAAWRRTGAAGMAELAAGITSARKAPLDAFDTLKQMLKDAMTPQQEQLRLHGELLSKTLAKGLKSGDPAVRAQAIATAKMIADRLGQLAQAGGKAGKESLIALRDGMKSKDPAVRDASTTAYNAAMSALNPLPAAAGAVGAAAGQSLADQLKAKVAAALAGVLADIAALPGKYSSAPGAPMHDSRAPTSSTPTAAPAVPHGAVYALGTSYVPFDQVALVHRAEMIVPAAESDAIRSGRATLGTGGAGRGDVRPLVGNLIINNPRPEPASTSTRRELRKLSLSGSAI